MKKKLDKVPMNAIISQDSKNQCLSVVIPDELKDYTYIQVKIVKSENIY